jgi:hypothetical protein
MVPEDFPRSPVAAPGQRQEHRDFSDVCLSKTADRRVLQAIPTPPSSEHVPLLLCPGCLPLLPACWLTAPHLGHSRHHHPQPLPTTAEPGLPIRPTHLLLFLLYHFTLITILPSPVPVLKPGPNNLISNDASCPQVASRHFYGALPESQP